MTTQKLESMVTTLEATGNYRVLRRLDVARSCSEHTNGVATKVACVVDVETTGLDAARDEIIQVAICPFRYSIGATPRVVEALPEFNRYRQPSRPIGQAITELTGIDNATVAGHRIESEEVDAFLSTHQIDFIVAHNARFDRAFLERAYPKSFVDRRWLCSLSQVPWQDEAFRGKSLAFLAMQAGLFCRSHVAAEDCRALVALLNHPLPVTGRNALSYLLALPGDGMRARAQSAVGPMVRIRAQGAPFESKDLLKARGYRWCSGANGEPKAWFTEVTDQERDAEIAFLSREILGPRGNALVEDILPF